MICPLRLTWFINSKNSKCTSTLSRGIKENLHANKMLPLFGKPFLFATFLLSSGLTLCNTIKLAFLWCTKSPYTNMLLSFPFSFSILVSSFLLPFSWHSKRQAESADSRGRHVAINDLWAIHYKAFGKLRCVLRKRNWCMLKIYC